MRILLAFVLLAVACAGAAPLAGAAPGRQDGGAANRQAGEGAAAEVTRLEREWLDAYEKSDPEAMDRIVAEDFTITFPDGHVQTKPELMRQTRAMRQTPPPVTTRFRTEQGAARVYGDTVVLVGLVIIETTRGDKTSTERYRYTDTYARVGGRWQVVASHLSNAPAPKP
ncbi:MAG TPA: nuclear transport factor 2 family protein [Pyrinomonadaceae bacterium]|nr:nuclear transport factor 2 family protein [Pyrinomonadaceae bacterium]